MFSLDGWYLNQARHFFCVSKLCQQVVLVQIAKLTLTEYLLGQESSPYPLPTGEHTVQWALTTHSCRSWQLGGLKTTNVRVSCAFN